jgi:hypothetical protein
MSYAETFDWILDYATSEEYLKSSAEKKREALWVAGQKTRYVDLPPVTYSLITAGIGMLNLAYLRLAFSTAADVRPPRTKLFHPFGILVKVVLEPVPGNPFTGLFATGAIGLARLSLSMDEQEFIPSAAFKWFIDGQASRNMLLDRSLDPEPTTDFFGSNPTNYTNAPKMGNVGRFWWLINWWLGLVSSPLVQPLDQLANVTRYGDVVETPVAPFQIFLAAPKERHFDPRSKQDFRSALMRIPAGSVLYEATAIVAQGAPPVPVATIRTQSEFTASAFCDRVISLHHTANSLPPQAVSAG